MSTAGVVIDYPARRDGSYGLNRGQIVAHGLFPLVDELLFGGAAGPGKTDYIIAEVLRVLFRFPGAGGAIFRRTHPQLLGEIGSIGYRLLERIPRSVGTYNASSHVWTFANGSHLSLNHCQRDADVTKYQGAQWSVVAFDQLEQFTEFQYRYLLHRLRADNPGLAEAFDRAGYRPKAISSANPGGVGHGWVKRRFIDPFPTGNTPFRPAPDDDDPDPGVRVFVPGTIDDNLDNVGEAYLAQLNRLPADERRAMRHGDWNVHTGQRFRDFRTAVHVIEPEAWPIRPGAGTVRGVGVDYGMDAPYAALWGAKFLDNLVVVYREVYAAGLTPAEQARRILAAEAPGERRPGRPVPVWLDPSTWARNPNHPDSGPGKTIGGDKDAPPVGSIAHTYRANGVPVTKATNDRLAGVALVADKLRVRGDHLPRLLIYSTCRNLIRTLPELIRDEKRPEDVDTKGEDHAYDALRYLLMGLEGRPSSHAIRNRNEADAAEARAGRRPAPSPPTRAVTAGLRKREL